MKREPYEAWRRHVWLRTITVVVSLAIGAWVVSLLESPPPISHWLVEVRP